MEVDSLGGRGGLGAGPAGARGRGRQLEQLRAALLGGGRQGRRRHLHRRQDEDAANPYHGCGGLG